MSHVTVLFNENTQEFMAKGRKFVGGYKVSGVPQKDRLPNHIHELTVVDSEPPIISSSEKMSSVPSEWVVDLVKGEYRKQWNVEQKSAVDLAKEDWVHLDYPKRIVAQKSMADPANTTTAPMAVAFFTYFEIQGNPRVDVDANTVHIYISQIAHQGQLLAMEQAGVVTVEDIPTILTQ